MKRDEALTIIESPPYNMDSIKSETDYVLKKLGISHDEFQKIWIDSNKSFLEYPSYYPYINKFIRLVVPLLKYIVPVKPKIFYEMEARKNS